MNRFYPIQPNIISVCNQYANVLEMFYTVFILSSESGVHVTQHFPGETSHVSPAATLPAGTGVDGAAGRRASSARHSREAPRDGGGI